MTGFISLYIGISVPARQSFRVLLSLHRLSIHNLTLDIVVAGPI